MDTNVTLSVRSILLAVLVLLALVTAYLLGGSGGRGTPAQAADETPAPAAAERRALTTTGTGHAGAVPDQLSFRVTVAVTRPDLDDALAAANGTVSRVLAALKGHGVARSDVQTTGLSMHAVYDYHPYDPPTIRGYRVSERAAVLVDELEDGGAAVSAAVSAGGNDVRVGGIRLLVGEPDAALAEARDAAVEEATAKAEQYAEATGQRLGAVATLREVHTRPLSTPTYPVEAARDGMVEDLSALPVRAGRDEASVTVQVVWELQ